MYLHRYSSQVNGIFFRTRIVATENMSVCLGKRGRVRGGEKICINFFLEEQGSTSLIPWPYILPGSVLGMRLRLFIAYVCI